MRPHSPGGPIWYGAGGKISNVPLQWRHQGNVKCRWKGVGKQSSSTVRKGKQASERVILLLSRPSRSRLEAGGGWITDLNRWLRWSGQETDTRRVTLTPCGHWTEPSVAAAATVCAKVKMGPAGILSSCTAFAAPSFLSSYVSDMHAYMSQA